MIIGISTADFRAALADGPFAWPGGYPKYFLTVDGSALCYQCAEKEKSRVVFMARTARLSALHRFPDDGFRVLAVEVNWEDSALYCDHCSNAIVPAYGEHETETETRKG